jgi:hypothetical protein
MPMVPFLLSGILVLDLLALRVGSMPETEEFHQRQHGPS